VKRSLPGSLDENCHQEVTGQHAWPTPGALERDPSLMTPTADAALTRFGEEVHALPSSRERKAF